MAGFGSDDLSANTSDGLADSSASSASYVQTPFEVKKEAPEPVMAGGMNASASSANRKTSARIASEVSKPVSILIQSENGFLQRDCIPNSFVRSTC